MSKKFKETMLGKFDNKVKIINHMYGKIEICQNKLQIMVQL